MPAPTMHTSARVSADNLENCGTVAVAIHTEVVRPACAFIARSTTPGPVRSAAAR